MDKEELERKIVEASDGLLNEKELHALEVQLKEYPELYRDYRSVMALPDMEELYPKKQAVDFYSEIESLRHKLSGLKNLQHSFEEISIIWFQKYALAASLLIFALTSLYSVSQTGLDEADDVMIEELFYPVEESAADDYQWYLEELIEQ